MIEAIKSHEVAMLDTFSADLKDVLAGLLAKDPSKRLTIEQMLAHPWSYCEPVPEL